MLEKIPNYVQLATMSRWYVVSRAIHTVAKLGIANHMSEIPVSVNKLALLSQTEPALLNRLLQFLTDYGLFVATNDAYALTPLAMPLRDDDPHSLRQAFAMVNEHWWCAFAQLEPSLQTSTSAFYLQHQTDFLSFITSQHSILAEFNQGMKKLTYADDELILNQVNVDNVSHLVDVGGGRSNLTALLAQRYPKLTITLIDHPTVINSLDKALFTANVTLVAGEIKQHLPAADAYLFKGILHDFDTPAIHNILANCLNASPGATLIIAEQIIPDDPGPHINKTMDIVMMTLSKGQQRTLKGWQQVVCSAGFKHRRSYATGGLFTLMEFC